MSERRKEARDKEMREEVEAIITESPICVDLSTGKEGCNEKYCEKYNGDCITCLADRVITKVQALNMARFEEEIVEERGGM